MSAALPKEVLKLLDRLVFLPSIRSKKILAGRHSSLLVGSSPDFKEYREYQTGEDIRDIDWRASGRSKHLLVRKQEHQALVEHWLILDGSKSMDFPVSGRSKSDVQKLLVGVLLYLLNAQGDPVGLLKETQDKGLYFEPRKTSASVSQMVAELYEAGSGADAQLNTSIQKFKEGKSMPSVLWIISDFADHWDDTYSEIKSLRDEGHEVRVIHIFHKTEKDLPWNGDCEFEDLEGLISQINVDPESLKKKYLEEYETYVVKLRDSLIQLGISFYSYDMDEPLEKLIIELFQSQV